MQSRPDVELLLSVGIETADGQKDGSVRQRERKRGQVQEKLLIRYGTFSSHSRELVFSTFKENPTEA